MQLKCDGVKDDILLKRLIFSKTHEVGIEKTYFQTIIIYILFKV